jgi:hypothetical protein
VTIVPVDTSRKDEAITVFNGLKGQMEKIDGWTGSSLNDAGDHFLGISTWEKYDANIGSIDDLFQDFVPSVKGQPDCKVGTVVAPRGGRARAVPPHLLVQRAVSGRDGDGARRRADGRAHGALVLLIVRA